VILLNDGGRRRGGVKLKLFHYPNNLVKGLKVCFFRTPKAVKDAIALEGTKNWTTKFK